MKPAGRPGNTRVNIRVNVVIRFSALGDLILTTAFLQKLRAERPDEDIVLVTHPQFRELITEKFPVRCHVIAAGKNDFGILGYLARGYRALAQVRLLKADAVEIFDLHNVGKSRVWAWGFRWNALLKSIPVRRQLINKHRWDRWKLLRFKVRRHRPFFVYQESQKLLAGAQTFLPKLLNAEKRPENFSILMALDAQHWKKVWPSDQWIQLISLLHNSNLKNIRITLVGQKSKVPDLIPENFLSSGKFTLENLVGKTELRNLPALAATHHVCVCGNSAWQHLCESVGTPVLSLLGPLDSEFGFSPFLENSHEYSVDLACRPCTLHGGGACKLSGDRFHACMRDIPAKEVYSSLILMGAKT